MACSISATRPAVGHVIQIAFRVGNVEIDGRRNLAVLHGNDGCGHAGGAASALRVSDLRFQSRHGNLAGPFAERQFEGAGLDPVVHFGGSTVQVDVLNILRAQACFLKRQRDGARGFFRRIAHAHAVIRFAGRSRSRQSRHRRARPRARACSYSSRMNIHEPSASTKPSRSAEKGREARSGA